jgi:hypothetical protein
MAVSSFEKGGKLNEIKENIVVFDVESTEIIDENPDSRFMIAKINAFSSGRNLNKMTCSEEVLQSTADSIYNVPIIYNIVRSKNDFGTHTRPEDSLICGFVIPDSAKFIRLEDGRLSLSVLTRISKRYSPKVVEILRKRDGNSNVSVEMNLTELEVLPDGYTDMLSFTYLGVCLLGLVVQEAVVGSELEVLSFAQANEEFKHDYDAEFSNKYSTLDFTIPKNVKLAAKKSLESGETATSVSLAMARFLINNEKITSDKIHAMAKFHNRKVEMSDLNRGFFGGKAGALWSKEMTEKINEIDNKRMSYFDEEIVGFPYKSIEEAPASIQKLDGVALTVSQANEIAKQADAIGGEYAWPTAIKSWKSRHKIVDKRWVKKDNNEKKEDLSVNEDEKDLKQENMAEEKLPEAENKAEEMAAEPEKESPEQEKKEGEEEKESPAEEKSEESKEKEEEKNMSLDAYLDVSAILAFLQEETEDYQKLVEGFAAPEGEKPFAHMCKFMYGKMCKMAADKKAAEDDRDTYMAERDELKKFKADVEAKEFSFSVEKTIAEISTSMPKKEVEAVREDSKNYNLETFDAWYNKTRSIAFSFVKEETKKDGITRMQLPWQQGERRKSVWDELEKNKIK